MKGVVRMKTSSIRWWIGFVCGLLLIAEGVYVIATEEWQYRGGTRVSGKEAVFWGIFTLATGLFILIFQILTKKTDSRDITERTDSTETKP